MFFKTDLRSWVTAVAQLAERSLQIPEVRVFESSNVQNFMQNMSLSLSLSLSLLLTVEKTKVKKKSVAHLSSVARFGYFARFWQQICILK